MPISFWNDRRGASATGEELRELRERYVADGRLVADRLARDPNVLAVWLSGPFTARRVSPGSDLHMAVLIRNGEGRSRSGTPAAGTGGNHYYHHRLPDFSEVGRRLEIAFLPLGCFEDTIARGPGRWADVYDCHKLADIVPLFDRDGTMSALRERLGVVRPANMFVGAEIGVLRGEWELTGRMLEEGRLGDGILHARRLASAALMLFAVAARGLLFSKSAQLRGILAADAPPSRLRGFDGLQGIAGIGAREAERLVKRSSALVRALYEGRGVCSAGSD